MEIANERQQLIEIILGLDTHSCKKCQKCGIYQNESIECDDRCFAENTADYLIAKGVTIPVKCKDCKHREDGLCPVESIEQYPWFTKNTDYCSYGERKITE